jgi:hypothetical protein
MEFPDMVRGDLFRLYDQDGTPVDGGEVHVADSDAFERDELWGIKSHPAGRGQPVRYIDVEMCGYCPMNHDSTCQPMSRLCPPDGVMPDWCPLLEGPVHIVMVEKE